ncbi:MAG: hypothetical protein J6J11_00245 [Treponema sp.]|nr:hypothetical protein [Clostridia bacterium]MBP3606741.1 hypothetical protein [Treponema sp.]
MTLIYIFLLIIVLVNPYGRIASLNFPFTIFYAIRDTYEYFRYRKWNNFKTGKIWCYSAPEFGGGKTLSAVQYFDLIYQKYNNKKVWDSFNKRWAIQKIRFISNVEFTKMPFDDFTCVKQLIDSSNKAWKEADLQNGTLTCHVFLMDEAGGLLNSREFKNNLDPKVLEKIVTFRHNHISFCMTAQSFEMIDIAMRRVTSTVVYVLKCWRIYVQKTYRAKELEIAGDFSFIKPLKVGGFFARDKHFEAYDTHAAVDSLIKKWEAGDLLTTEEILVCANSNLTANPDAVLHPSKGLKRMINKRNRKK